MQRISPQARPGPLYLNVLILHRTAPHWRLGASIIAHRSKPNRLLLDKPHARFALASSQGKAAWMQVPFVVPCKGIARESRNYRASHQSNYADPRDSSSIACHHRFFTFIWLLAGPHRILRTTVVSHRAFAGPLRRAGQSSSPGIADAPSGSTAEHGNDQPDSHQPQPHRHCHITSLCGGPLAEAPPPPGANI
jgi:hypothetical protein